LVIESTSRQKSSRDQPPLSEFTSIVRPPGQPAAIRVFTDATRADAEMYASESGAVIETLL
jgi:hypothetical protein